MNKPDFFKVRDNLTQEIQNHFPPDGAIIDDFTIAYFLNKRVIELEDSFTTRQLLYKYRIEELKTKYKNKSVPLKELLKAEQYRKVYPNETMFYLECLKELKAIYIDARNRMIAKGKPMESPIEFTLEELAKANKERIEKQVEKES